MISVDSQGMWVVFAAPDGAWVRILIDHVEVVHTNSSNKGQISGLGIAWQPQDDCSQSAVDAVDVEVCNCITHDQQLLSSLPLPALENPLDPELWFMHHEVLCKFGEAFACWRYAMSRTD
eukprot:999642-Rhodomonas_salina.2